MFSALIYWLRMPSSVHLLVLPKAPSKSGHCYWETTQLWRC